VFVFQSTPGNSQGSTLYSGNAIVTISLDETRGLGALSLLLSLLLLLPSLIFSYFENAQTQSTSTNWHFEKWHYCRLFLYEYTSVPMEFN
jgi:hypothetical protein